MFQLVAKVFSLGPWVLCGAVLAVGGLYLLLGGLPLLPAKLRTVGAVFGLAGAAFCAGHVSGSTGPTKQLRAVKRELVQARARQEELQFQAHARLEKINELVGIAEGYAEELSNGTANSCPVDPAYKRRLRSILAD